MGAMAYRCNSIVMHGGWYVEERFIKKYGRAGRSWGCPAVPDNLTDPILNAIKENALLVIYYPSDDWLSKSRFLKCAQINPKQVNPVINDNPIRDDILFTDIHQRSKSEENTAVAVISADSYIQLFHTTPPLARMLRRQINNAEYIALSSPELDKLIANHALSEISFVNPVIKMSRGYYITDMHIAALGKIKEITLNTNLLANNKAYTVLLDDNKSINIKSTDRFIRWVGL